MASTDLWEWTAKEAARAVRAGEVRPSDLVTASIERIGRLDGELKAFITLSEDAARKEAALADLAVERGAAVGPLHGLPVAIKDLTRTAGIRTTFGCSRYRDFVPAHDELCVARLKKAGAIVVGKTNTPEFGFGALSHNRLFGPTANPYDYALTSGGSSGGSAVAVSSGMVPLAHGTDFGGSVRTPAAFCGVVGLRPTPGRIPAPDQSAAWNHLSVHGVLARNVEDVALMLAAMAGPDSLDPVSAGTSQWDMPDFEERPPSTTRIAFSENLGGLAPVDREMGCLLLGAMDAAATMFPNWAEDAPDCTGARESFSTLRGAILHHTYHGLLDEGTDDLTESFVWNVSRGRGITAEAYLDAEAVRRRIYRSFIAFFEKYDVLAMPSTSVPPFSNAAGGVSEINDVPLENIIDYLAVTYVVSLAGMPCLSLPCGLSEGGLPVGLQLVAPPFQEARLLQVARALEALEGFRHKWPPCPEHSAP